MSTAFCFIHSLSDLSNLIPLEAQNCKKHRLLLLHILLCQKLSELSIACSSFLFETFAWYYFSASGPAVISLEH